MFNDFSNNKDYLKLPFRLKTLLYFFSQNLPPVSSYVSLFIRFTQLLTIYYEEKTHEEICKQTNTHFGPGSPIINLNRRGDFYFFSAGDTTQGLAHSTALPLSHAYSRGGAKF